AVWNKQWLCFSFEVEDDDIVLFESDDPEEAALGSDRVELFFATDETLAGPYYGAEMDPAGRVFDYRAKFYREIDGGWSFSTLEFGGDISEGGYRVDGRIQIEELKDLNLLRENRIVAGVYRAEFSRGSNGIQEDWISWVDPETEQPDFHVPQSFGVFHLAG
ncbi:MAG: sugar-binding protein, partial [Verrucomicrobiota bacterium]